MFAEDFTRAELSGWINTLLVGLTFVVTIIIGVIANRTRKGVDRIENDRPPGQPFNDAANKKSGAAVRWDIAPEHFGVLALWNHGPVAASVKKIENMTPDSKDTADAHFGVWPIVVDPEFKLEYDLYRVTHRPPMTQIRITWDETVDGVTTERSGVFNTPYRF